MEIQEQIDTLHSTSKYFQELISNLSTQINEKKEEFDEALKKIEATHLPDRIILNIGGNYFHTTLDTIKKADEGSFFNSMFSGKFNLKTDKDGSFFIDR